MDKFFDSLTSGYTEVIERCFPRYREMLWALLDYLPDRLDVGRILELGSGTGNLTVLLSKRFPEATIHAVDVSGDSIAECRKRLAGARLEYHHDDFRNLAFPSAYFDLVISSISIHHLDSAEKRQMFSRSFDWLTAEGVFAYADQHAGATDDLYRQHIANWRSETMAAGSSEQEWEMWMQHQAEHDHHDPLLSQMDWLRQSGFSTVDCPWRYLLWAVVQARK